MADIVKADGAEPAEVRIGDKVHRIRPFKGSKGVRAFAIISRISDRASEIMQAVADFEDGYRKRNRTVIDRSLARYRMVGAQNAIDRLEHDLASLADDQVDERRRELRSEGEAAETAERKEAIERALADLEDVPALRRQIIRSIENQQQIVADWQRMLETGLAESESIEVPRQPSAQQTWFAAFPKVWELAESEATMLLGLLMISDDDLKSARADGRADEAIAELGEQMLDDLEVDEVADLVVTAAEFAVARYRPRMARLGERAEAVQGMLMPSRSDQPGDEEADQVLGPDRRRTEPVVGTVEREESASLSADSSTGSDEPTGGPPSGSSSASSGQTSSPSPS